MSPTDALVLASGNPGKIREFGQLFAPLGLRVRPQADFGVTDVEETGLTFIENALLKARAASRASGLPALADDSGLEVDALAGSPGIYSARYAGEPKSDARNNAKLLESLSGVSGAARSARYWCALVYLRHAEDPVPIIVQRSWEGEILEQPCGEGGFGYDPLFWLPALGRSVAELDAAEKNRLSHRGRALEAMLAALREATRR
ncbi:RdgB/HAM1 family non-canonical purine NTP pyrophosphatase [Halomonas sp. MCCC 1A17488]|uniref:dITP/XTP pyrophosphatase n=1 Tax=Billgrantia sulfidoxydans TaxID=2733484 RepID=A0ABX7WBI4_9GAMM|nr:MULTISPECIES: RdgB/HAM1 family non-canonical purine NTP pyrophosphatase [Halomonas]MCE8017264.1 RdgB/HAM1 family non-canonical purine NTP pyrophosphatase [Halomonas sp. MCCC 1A17488]MCG3240597.1 RdgB/HAM1 family non-canonical purine NTP pyrophosphatase [Halomonas sp. MCCC 1A17488]QPP49551.1 RdgB/HAM1 family non-canonical purine NTP pyrophosphatase [Halomonas sp. SS10-MC5]QTP56907.1 RdgB/HAM1 family non-canonical purine NTP pyrophosphatase [Halomonas sulfidoxydans]